MTRLRSLRRGEGGYALLIALVFIGAIALVISALLTQSISQFKAEQAFRHQREGVFAADAGLEHAIAGVGMIPGEVDPGFCSSVLPIGGPSAAANGSASSSPRLDNFNLTSSAGSSRMLIVAISHQGDRTMNWVRFNGQDMTRARREQSAGGGNSNTTEVWYMLDANLPAAAGSSYDITTSANGNDQFAIHASAWTGVAQSAPAAAGSSLNTTNHYIETTMAPAPAEGSLLYSAAGTSRDNQSVMVGNGAGTRLSGLSSAQSPSSATFGTSYRIAAVGDNGLVRETFVNQADPASHVLLSIQPASGDCSLAPSLDAHLEGVESGFFSTSVTLGGFPLGAPAGRNRLVLVAVHDGDNAASVTFAGEQMTLARRVESGGSRTSIWYLLDPDLPAPGNHSITVTSASPLDLFPSFTIHASSWTGVLQGFGPSDDTPNPKSGAITSITTAVNTDTAGALVFSAAGHQNSGAGGMGPVTGATRLSNGPADSGTSFGTAYTVVPTPTTGYEVTETFAAAGNPTSHVLLAFRPASWAPAEFGAACEDGLGPFDYNGYSVEVTCEKDPAQDVILAVSTATNDAGRSIIGRATVTRLPSGTIEITEWDTRPTADP